MLTEERSKETFEPWHIRVRVQLVLTLKSHSFFREQEAQYLYINSMKGLAWSLSLVWNENISYVQAILYAFDHQILLLKTADWDPWKILQVSWFLKNCHSSHETWFLILKSLKTQGGSLESRLSTSFEAISLRSGRLQRIPQTLTLLGHKEVDTIFLEFLLEWIDKRTLSRDKQLSDHLSRKEYYHWIGYMWKQINLSIKVKTTALYNFPGGCSLLTQYTQT